MNKTTKAALLGAWLATSTYYIHEQGGMDELIWHGGTTALGTMGALAFEKSIISRTAIGSALIPAFTLSNNIRNRVCINMDPALIQSAQDTKIQKEGILYGRSPLANTAKNIVTKAFLEKAQALDISPSSLEDVYQRADDLRENPNTSVSVDFAGRTLNIPARTPAEGITLFWHNKETQICVWDVANALKDGIIDGPKTVKEIQDAWTIQIENASYYYHYTGPQ